MKLRGTHALVTGGASGIGKAIAQLFQDEGAAVTVFDINKPAFSDRFTRVDLRDERQIAHAMAAIRKLDILVNNAGVYFRTPVEETATQQLDDVFAVNFRAAYLLSRHALPLLRKSKGTIINIASELAIVPEAESAAYCSSKAALLMLTRCLAKAYAGMVRVNAILPGPVDTPMLRNAFASREELEDYLQQNPMKRAAKPEEVAKLALFLASDDAAYITGGQYAIDGGESL